MDETKIFADMLIKDTETKNSKTNYITYSDRTEEIKLDTYNQVFVSTKYTYKDEVFTLDEPTNIDVNKITDYVSNDNQKYYNMPFLYNPYKLPHYQYCYLRH